MARSYQVSVPPGSKATIADLVTLGGGATVTIRNTHASVDLYLSGDENEDTTGQKARTSSTVGATTAFILPGTRFLTVNLTGGESLYGLSSNATVTLSVMVFRTNYARGGNSVT